ncbi:MAG: hypothetical protein Q8M29_15765 [Bacteroidota bacterium]|nr:hypothetical protein [Bacteroidota bacterium]
METTSIFEFAKSLLFMIPELAILVACIYYMSKSTSVDSVLMAIGSFIGICVMVFYRFIFPMMQYSGNGGVSSSMVLFNVVSFIAFIGSVLFAIGLFMLVVKYVKKKDAMQF